MVSDSVLKRIAEMFDKKTRERIEKIGKEEKENASLLENIVTFFEEHEAKEEPGTHESPSGDWMTFAKSFNCGDDNTELCRHIARCHDLQLSPSVEEVLTDQFQFFITVKFGLKSEEWKAKDKVLDYLLDENKPILQNLAAVLKRAYPQQKQQIFCWTSMVDKQVTLITEVVGHFVVRNVVVDKERAITLLQEIKDGCDEAPYHAELRDLGKDCSFGKSLDEKQYQPRMKGGKVLVRMPFCDTTSNKKLDFRPLEFAGLLLLADEELKWVVGRGAEKKIDCFKKEEVIKSSTVRRIAGSPLTEWISLGGQKKEIKGAQRNRTHEGSKA